MKTLSRISIVVGLIAIMVSIVQACSCFEPGETGAGLDWHLDRTAELDTILDKARIEDFSVDNGDRPLREVALEILRRAGWPPHHESLSH